MTNIIELARQAGAETQDGGEHFEFDDFDIFHFARLIRADEREKSTVKSFAETYSYNPRHTCKCEHLEACDDCHPGYGSAIRERGKA